MTTEKQLWLIAGGNGAGKSTFYRMYLAPKGIKVVNADLIAKEIDPKNPEKASYKAATWASWLIEDLLYQGISFCYETVFSHESKIDFTAKARSLGYEIILVFIHLDIPELNEARVIQRVTMGGHNVPSDKIYSRIPRTMKHVAKILPIVNQARFLNNSSREDPFQLVAVIKKGRCDYKVDHFPGWAENMLKEML